MNRKMEGIATWIIALGFIGSPIYFLYLWQNHGPPHGGQWMSRMEVTKMRRVMAFVFGIFSLLGGILSLPGILAIVGIVIAAVLFAYTKDDTGLAQVLR